MSRPSINFFEIWTIYHRHHIWYVSENQIKINIKITVFQTNQISYLWIFTIKLNVTRKRFRNSRETFLFPWNLKHPWKKSQWWWYQGEIKKIGQGLTKTQFERFIWIIQNNLVWWNLWHGLTWYNLSASRSSKIILQTRQSCKLTCWIAHVLEIQALFCLYGHVWESRKN